MRLGLTYLLLLLSSAGWAHQRPQVEYVANKGQWEGEVLFRASLGNGAVFLEADGFSFSFLDAQCVDAVHEYNRGPQFAGAPPLVRGHAWRMRLSGASGAHVEGIHPLPWYSNFLVGNEHERHAERVPSFEAVQYTGVYPGVNLRVHQGSGHFKYDFILSPGSDPGAIALQWEGMDALTLEEGRLRFATSVGEFIEQQPYAFQVIEGQVREVACAFRLHGTMVSFDFPEGYDSTQTLVIDPELIAATLSGSTFSQNYGHTATFDMEGNIYAGCISFGPGYPVTPGAFQVFFGSGGGWIGTDIGLSKLDPEGTDLIWATYVGGSGNEHPHSIWANEAGQLFVYGTTVSPNFPVTPGAFDTSHNGGTDIVVFRMSADGTHLLGSTFIGGSGEDGYNAAGINFGDTYRGEIILGQQGRVLVASCTSSADFPVTPGALQPSLSGGQDAVFLRLSPGLMGLEASTFLGSSGNDMAYGLRQAEDGSVFLCGMAGAANFPTSPGAWQSEFLGGAANWSQNEMDAFVARISFMGNQLIHSTFLSTSEDDQAFFIDLDSQEDVFVFGQCGEMPVIGNVYSNPGSRQFIAKLNPELSTVLLSTVIGSGIANEWSSGDFVPDAFLVDHCNNVYISSYQAINVLPVTADALYPEGGFYLAVFTEDLAGLAYATYYTGNHVDGGTSRFDKNGIVYQAVCSGGDFATTPDAWATGQVVPWDVGVLKIDFNVNGVHSAATAPDLSGCAPYVCQFENFSTGSQFFWDFGDGGTSTSFAPVHTFMEPGVYQVTMIASDELSCNLADTTVFEISVSQPVDYIPSFNWNVECATLTFQSENTTGYDFLEYIWDMGDGTTYEGEDVSHIYPDTGHYIITLQAIDYGCLSDVTFQDTVAVFNEVVATLPQGDFEGCVPFDLSLAVSDAGVAYSWDPGDGSPLVASGQLTHVYAAPGTYTLTLHATGTGECEGEDQVQGTVTVIAPAPMEAMFEVSRTGNCEDLSIQVTNLSTGEDLTYAWWMSDGYTSDALEFSRACSQEGEYVILLQVTESLCGTTDTAGHTVSVFAEPDLGIPESATLCHYTDSVVIGAANPSAASTYLWSTGETTPVIGVSESGAYSLQVNENGCTFWKEIEVRRIGAASITGRVSFCEGTSRYIEIPVARVSQYAWCTGDSAQAILIGNPGEYCFRYVDENGCEQEGRIVAEWSGSAAQVYVPNAFTPNADGVNDVFLPESSGVDTYSLSVWNRWGEEVFRTQDPAEPWNGSFRRSEHFVPDGAYPYMISYRGACSPEMVHRKGMVMVIR